MKACFVILVARACLSIASTQSFKFYPPEPISIDPNVHSAGYQLLFEKMDTEIPISDLQSNIYCMTGIKPTEQLLQINDENQTTLAVPDVTMPYQDRSTKYFEELFMSFPSKHEEEEDEQEKELLSLIVYEQKKLYEMDIDELVPVLISIHYHKREISFWSLKTDLIHDVISKLHCYRPDIMTSQVDLFFEGHRLNRSEPLEAYNVVNGSVLLTNLYDTLEDQDKESVFNKCKLENQAHLLFNEGPTSHVDQILDTLAQHNLKATFVTTQIEENLDTLKKIVDAGHQLANHALTHKDLTKLTDQEIRDEMATVQIEFDMVYDQESGTKKPIYVVPPFGSIDQHVLRLLVDELDFKVLMWNLDVGTWRLAPLGNTEQSNELVVANLKKKLDRYMEDGKKSFVVSIHDMGGEVPLNLNEIIKTITDAKINIVSLQECVQHEELQCM